MESQADQQRRAAENQALLRTVNARIEELNKQFEMFTPYGSWACECARLDCVQQVELTIDEYEQVREHPARFVVAPAEEHVFPEVERVVAETERYWVVEKVGAGAERATELAEQDG